MAAQLVGPKSGNLAYFSTKYFRSSHHI